MFNVSLPTSFQHMLTLPSTKNMARIGTAAITGLAIYAISNIPRVSACDSNGYQNCLSVCKAIYGDSADLILCFQQCRQYYGC
jgi:hypothetical protein